MSFRRTLSVGLILVFMSGLLSCGGGGGEPVEEDSRTRQQRTSTECASTYPCDGENEVCTYDACHPRGNCEEVDEDELDTCEEVGYDPVCGCNVYS